MIARARIALKANAVPEADRHARDLAQFETVEVTGEGADWETAKDACEIPADAQILAWFRDE